MTLYRRGGSIRVAVAIARLAEVPLGVILDGGIVLMGRCPTCGQQILEKKKP
jgi:hypothetical protein